MSKHGVLAWVAGALISAPALTFAQSAPGGCDRECLKGFVNAYIGAMVAHDAGKAQLASNFVLVENLKRIDTSAGLWSAASGAPKEFQIYVPDVRAQQIGYIGVLEANGKPVQLALRLKVENRKVAEAEQLVIYSVGERALPNLQKPRKAFGVVVPEPYRDSRGRLLYIGASYYQALDNNNGSLAPFADDCVRHENGTPTSRSATPDDPSALLSSVGLGCSAQLDTQRFSYITTIGNRRVWIADEETGQVFGLSQFHHASEQKVFEMIGIPGLESRTLDKPPYDKPFDMAAAHLFKVWGGKIHEIEAVGFAAPYNATSGSDLAAIESFNKRYLKALNDGDYVTLNSLTSEDHMMMMPNQPVFAGKAKLDEANRNAAEKYRIQESWQPIETVVSGDLAYQRGTFSATLTPKAGGPARGGDGKFLRIYRRQADGSWTMVIDSFSSDKPAKEAQ